MVFKPLPKKKPQYFEINHNEKTLVLNGTKYKLIDEVWDFLLQISTEKEFYKQKYDELSNKRCKILYS